MQMPLSARRTPSAAPDGRGASINSSALSLLAPSHAPVNDQMTLQEAAHVRGANGACVTLYEHRQQFHLVDIVSRLPFSGGAGENVARRSQRSACAPSRSDVASAGDDPKSEFQAAILARTRST
jgi:hypothetical protein